MPRSARERLLLSWGRLHIGEVIRRRAVLRALTSQLRTGSRVLDAGCGRGDIAMILARQHPGVAVAAMDIDPNLVALIRRRVEAAGLRNLSVYEGDVQDALSITRHATPPHGIIYSVDVFEHLRDPQGALRNLASALAPNGVIIIHTPHAHQRRWFRRFEHYEQHDHERDGFTPEELVARAHAVGLREVIVRHTFGPPGALAWELFHLAQGVGKWFAILTYPVTGTLALIDGTCSWKRGNGLLMVARRR